MGRAAGAVAAVVLLTGCGFAFDTAGRAPRECGFGDLAVEWSGTGTLEQLGLHADADFPHRAVGDAFVMHARDETVNRVFCFTLAQGNPQERWTVSAPVPEGWTPPGG